MTFDVHTAVCHNLYGKGEVVKITGDKVYVLFGKNQRIFPYPEAFEKGFLVADFDVKRTEQSYQDVSVPKTESASPFTGAIALSPKDIKFRIMVIKVNQLYEENMSPDALYSIVRGIWRASKEKAQTVKYVFGVYKSRIVAVYKPTEWLVCKEARDRLPRKDIELNPKLENRIFFIDKSYEQGLPPDENQKYYLGKSIDNLPMNKNAQNPITYLSPEQG